MRPLVIACVFAIGLASIATTAQAKCPGSAAAASKEIWASGNIPAGRSVTGTHPCGGRIECTGGTSAATRSRRCRWL